MIPAHSAFSSAKLTTAAECPPRVVIEQVRPCVDNGRFPIKRVIGEETEVTAIIHADGQDVLAAALKTRVMGETLWVETPMVASVNDRWAGRFKVTSLKTYEYTLEAWINRFMTWRHGFEKKVHAGQEVSNELLEGAQLIFAAAARANGSDASELQKWENVLKSSTWKSQLDAILDVPLMQLMARWSERHLAVQLEQPLRITVDRQEAVFSSWYEMFPRSAGAGDPHHGSSLREAEKQIPYIADMGFTVLYLPPVHPIGKRHRKGPNNNPQAGPLDPGSPWAIGSSEGGHKSVDPHLGTFDDFDHFVKEAGKKGLEIALDLAYQCSPDHPYIQEHPEWFLHRADGSIQYAENPPKKYEDIVPFNFECEQWSSLWTELKDIVLFWIAHGVFIFRVDNPHTKSYRFWEWLIQEVKHEHPETLFLAEAFTRPNIMRYLAKCGFTQSYTYFTWRNTSEELTEYLTELTQTRVAEFLRPNFFTNTPDILHAYLQTGGRAAHQIRFVLAATLSASFGIYGPAFELCENTAIPGTEDYQDSEKFQIRSWDMNRPGNIIDLITRVNFIRKNNGALHSNGSLVFCKTDNNQLLGYIKFTRAMENIILTVVNVDPHNTQWGRVRLPLGTLGFNEQDSFQVQDLLSDATYSWRGEANFVRLDPHVCPAHIFRLTRM